MKKRINTKRQISKEINLKTIHLGLDCRKYLQWYYASGGGNTAFGDFKGRVLKINKKEILFKWIYVDFMEIDGNYVTGKEDHIWVFDKEPFIRAGIRVNDCVSFTGKVYAYKRQDKSIDFSLKECEDIKKTGQYELPSDGKLEIQSLERLACEVCMFHEQCYNICINPDWRESMIEGLLEMK